MYWGWGYLRGVVRGYDSEAGDSVLSVQGSDTSLILRDVVETFASSNSGLEHRMAGRLPGFSDFVVEQVRYEI